MDIRHLRYRVKSLLPTSMLGSLTLYLALLRLGVFLLQALLVGINRRNAAQILDGWAAALTFIVAVLASWLLIRWIRQRLLWSLRNRLIVTYVFIGVIPVVLILCMVRSEERRVG